MLPLKQLLPRVPRSGTLYLRDSLLREEECQFGEIQREVVYINEHVVGKKWRTQKTKGKEILGSYGIC